MESIANLQNLVSDAVESVEFKLIRSPKDVDDESLVFKPEMAHQIFGENENIFGYKDLQIRLLYTAGPLQIYIGVKYSNRIDDFAVHGMKSDDVISIIAEKLPNSCYYTSIDEFLGTLEKAKKFRPFGEKLVEHIIDDDHNNTRLFEIYKCDLRTPNFCPFFERLQTFVLWFVDAASYIDTEDPQWTYFVCYEKYKDLDQNYQYATVGYSTVYMYYAFPEHIRPRISQMLILPPFQKLGLGTKLVRTIYNQFRGDKKVIDITVEDPSPTFSYIRNFIDAELCKDLPAFNKNIIKNGFSKEMISEARQNFNINPKQCRTVYEILRLLHTNIHNEKDYKSYRLEIKKRLDLAYFKQMRDIGKLKKAGVDPQFMLATLPTQEERFERLQNGYEEIETEYEKVIERIK